MQSSQPVVYKDLVLVGGGHAHALVLKMWAMQPLPGVRLTLISPEVMTPYSGMLPGLVAGHYRFEDTHIDLVKLCQHANARFIRAAAKHIDTKNKKIVVADTERPAIGYDLLSINTGITPNLSIPGAREHTTPVKPIAQFYPKWQQQLQQLRTATSPQSLAIVGGGAAGIELALAMDFAIKNDPKIHQSVHIHLIYRGAELPSGYSTRFQKIIATQLQQAGIQTYPQSDVVQVEPQQLAIVNIEQRANGQVHQQQIQADHIFWCTNAAASQWPQDSTLAVDKDGFIAINDYLQSESHPDVFAAGDIAQQINNPRPKAGVFAVRQAPILFQNLRRRLLQQPLLAHTPQKNFLSLLACGDEYALGYRPGLPALSGGWVWRWKDHIDRKFMAMLGVNGELPDNTMVANDVVDPIIMGDDATQDISTIAMRCGGCGAKVGAQVLSRVIAQLQPITHNNVVLGLDSPDDAAAIQVQPQQLLMQSVDVFRAFIDEPYVLGQIAAEHALSDLFAMNAKPHSAMALATLPYMSETLVERDLLQLMSGAVQVLNKHQCALIGGHTSEGAELSIGFSVNGTAEPTQVLHKAGMQIGQHLILTQPLGTGTLFAAHGQNKAEGRWIESALQQMLHSNAEAGQVFSDFGASACTDITGFGLLGHLVEMLKHQKVGVAIDMKQLPALSGALECLRQGISSSLQPQNIRLRRAIANPEGWLDSPAYQLLFDPQTSGGLLASVDTNRSKDCVAALHSKGYQHARIIGRVLPDDSQGLITLC